MKFPAMNKRPRQAVVVPELSGGLNLRDSVSMINDNQLTDCKNVWFKDGVLKTRPGVRESILHSVDGVRNGDMRAHDIYLEKQVEKDGENMSYTVTENCRLFSMFDMNSNEIKFYWIGETYFETLPVIENATENYFVAQKDNTLYCYSREGVSKCDYTADELKWEALGEKDYYAPTIATNVDCYDYGFNRDNDIFAEGNMLESFNLLGHRYKFYASTVSKSALDSEFGTHFMTYVIPFSKSALYLIPEILEVKITYIDGTLVTHTATIEYPGSLTVFEEKETQSDGYKMKAEVNTKNKSNDIIQINFYDEENNIAVVKQEDYLLNNMEIIAPCSNDDKNPLKVMAMTRCTWFGGDSAGINGGTRLFLGGNTEEPNLVVWSDLNKPLYFPENNYFYVGEPSSRVTAFGKQSDMLVIFKDNETYFTQYNRNTNITDDNLIDQSVIDYVGSSVYFPLTLINANIGCDCPDTVQLCRNRLVWAGSDGKIYTLVSNNQYSERNIFEIGEMIHRKLCEDKALKKAHSTDWNGYYLLQSGNRVYVLDYNSYGYQYVSSYSKTEDANLRIPWYYWEFPAYYGASEQSVLAVADGKLKIVNDGIYGIFVCNISQDCATDNMLVSDPPTTANYKLSTIPIDCYMQTKLFEFGAQGYRKNVDKVMLSLGNNGGEPIKVEFITDEGSEEEYITLEGEDTKAYSPGYVKSLPLNPCIRSVERFGVKLSCEGPLAVDGITLFYRVLGGVK